MLYIIFVFNINIVDFFSGNKFFEFKIVRFYLVENMVLNVIFWIKNIIYVDGVVGVKEVRVEVVLLVFWFDDL